MECPKCGEKAHILTTTRGVTTLLGSGAGGYVAAIAGGKTGAVVGSFVCPGIGTAIGGLLGILTGAAAGAVAGNTVGKLIDENVMGCIVAATAITNGGLHNGTLSRL